MLHKLIALFSLHLCSFNLDKTPDGHLEGRSAWARCPFLQHDCDLPHWHSGVRLRSLSHSAWHSHGQATTCFPNIRCCVHDYPTQCEHTNPMMRRREIQALFDSEYWMLDKSAGGLMGMGWSLGGYSEICRVSTTPDITNWDLSESVHNEDRD